MYLTEEIAKEVDRVVFRIRAVGRKIIGNTKAVEMQNNITNIGPYFEPLPYVVVHMRIESNLRSISYGTNHISC